MMNLTHEALIEFSLNFIFYFTIGSLGAFMKDLYETLTKKNEKIRLGEVLIGGMCATVVGMAISDYSWFNSVSLNTTVFIIFILGMLGFELFGNLTTIAKFKNFVFIIISLRHQISNAKPDPPPHSGTDKIDNEDSNDVIHDDKDAKG